jgi:hypothetical protein
VAHTHSHSEPNLFGITPRTQRKPAPSAPPGVIQNLIGVYRQLYERQFHEPPVILKRDGAILKSLVMQFGAEKVEQRLRAFMSWGDTFVVDSGFALTMFQSCWNRLAAKCASQAPEADRDSGVAKTEAYLRNLRSVPRRASGR